MNKDKKSIFQRIVFPSKNKEFILDNDILTMTQNIAIARVKEIDEQIIQELYEIYKDKADELYIINEEEFKNFINIYLPIYLKQRGVEDE